MMNDGGYHDDNGEIHDDVVIIVHSHEWDAYHLDEVIRNCLAH